MTAPRNPDLLIDAFLAEGGTELPDQIFDAVRSDIHRTRQRVVLGPWREPNMLTPIRMAVAAAILVVAAGFAWTQINPPAPSIGTQPTAAPTIPASAAPVGPATPLSGANAELASGRYSIDYGQAPGASGTGPTIEFDVTAGGWFDVSTSAVDFVYPDGISYGPSFGVWNITEIAENPCLDHAPRTVASGVDIEALLGALADQAGIAAGPLTAVTIDGYGGQYVDLTIEADITTCPDGFYTWGGGDEGRAAKGNGEVDRVYALNVEGQLVTFFTRVLPDSASEHRGQLRRIVESIDIRP